MPKISLDRAPSLEVDEYKILESGHLPSSPYIFLKVVNLTTGSNSLAKILAQTLIERLGNEVHKAAIFEFQFKASELIFNG